MKKVVLFDTSVGTMNQGDNIIMDSVLKQTKEIREGNYVIHFPTHTPCFTAYQQSKHNSRYSFVRNADLKLICGTNIIAKRNLLPWPFWNVNLFNCGCYAGAVGMGVGSGGFGEETKIKGCTRALYKKILSKEYVHSTRDEKTKALLESIGLKAINTGCPTMWGLTPEHCSEIPTKKANSVVFTLTDGLNAPDADQGLIDLLVEKYDKVYYWPQGLTDIGYFGKMNNTDKITVISPDIISYSNLMKSEPDLDYVGTRLHAGIFAMQHKKRAIILVVDNRASDIAQTYHINVMDRTDMNALGSAIDSEFATEVKINLSNILEWKSQFLG